MTYWAPADLKWMDGYYGQPLVIVDEFRGGVPPSRILRLVDRYPFQAEVKGVYSVETQVNDNDEQFTASPLLPRRLFD